MSRIWDNIWEIFGTLAVLGTVSFLLIFGGYAIVKAATYPKEVDFCYIETVSSAHPAGPYYRLVAHRSWSANTNMEFLTKNEAEATAQQIGCSLK